MKHPNITLGYRSIVQHTSKFDTTKLDCQATINCVECKKEHLFNVNYYQTKLFLRTTDIKVQDAFPHLNSDEREMFLSGLCITCWDILFKTKD